MHIDHPAASTNKVPNALKPAIGLLDDQYCHYKRFLNAPEPANSFLNFSNHPTSPSNNIPNAPKPARTFLMIKIIPRNPIITF